jgi:hypothetical protein
MTRTGNLASGWVDQIEGSLNIEYWLSLNVVDQSWHYCSRRCALVLFGVVVDGISVCRVVESKWKCVLLGILVQSRFIY